MLGWDHSGGFSLHADVWVASWDRAGLERLLRYCARPIFAGERLAWVEPDECLIYHLPKPRPDGQTVLYLTPLEFLDRLATLVPPPRKHRHRYHGVLAPNAPLRPAVTAYAGLPLDRPAPPVPSPAPKTPAEPKRASPAANLWAVLLARIIRGVAFDLPRVRQSDATDRGGDRAGTSATDSTPHRRTPAAAACLARPFPNGGGGLRLGSNPSP